MSREGPRNQQSRMRIAQLAAQLMVEHGIKDHALAKRKAARQLGVTTTTGLPSNDEIDAELRAYVALFEPETHERDLEIMRRQAVEAMLTLARFEPVLTGGLALGTASRHSDIELEVYVDSSKEFEQFLLNGDIAFKSEERRGGSFFTLFSEPVDVVVHVLPVQSLQSAPREVGDARRRLTLEQLTRLLPSEGVAEDVAVSMPEYHGLDKLAVAGGK
jgi:hypothetical protein